jgi:asparagine synthase (glutamine-hydrolysing)
MCGIAGIVALARSADPSTGDVRPLCDRLEHRGPDDEGFTAEGAVALGARRLAIIDVAGGRQPYFSEDRRIAAVFNGEIYNFRTLRAELESRGHRLASSADGETLVHLWEEHGPGFLERLNGMFAIALHDRAARRLLLARDRLGIKPLFFARTATHLIFASEIKAILAAGLVPPELDPIALRQFLAWEYVPGPRTLFAGIRKLPPGALLDVDLVTGGISERTWWRLAPAPPPAARTDAEWEEALDAKIAECVKRQLVSDVPLGAFLSGGVDSSLVVHGMGAHARTFSIGFDDPSYDESRWAEQVARHLGVDHRAEILAPRVEQLFDPLMESMEDPIGDFSIFPTYLVSRMAREEVTVALTGDGGDELFGGYESVVAQHLAGIWGRFPTVLGRAAVERRLRRLRPRPQKKGLVNKAQRFAEGLQHEPALGHARWRLFAGAELLDELLPAAPGPAGGAANEEALAEHVLRLGAEARQAGCRGPIDQALYVDARSYLVDNCLVKVDRMSMACSLEARVPLLDHELVELAFALPERLKVDGTRTKVLLKRVATRHVPRECVHRPKQGFSIPIKHWLAGPLRPRLEELLDPRSLAAEGLFDAPTVKRLEREHFAGEANHSHVLWALLVVQDWRRRWGA